VDPSDWQESPLRLEDLRGELIRQEVTILFAFIERAQFARNDAIYEAGRIPIAGYSGSFFEYMLEQTERAHALAGRYMSCDEHAFSGGLPEPLVSGERYPTPIRPNDINANAAIRSGYFERVLPELVEPGDDRNYGSSATCDILCLQVLSRRVHYGKHIAEAKFQAEREAYGVLIERGDAAGLEQQLIDKTVERGVLERVREKAAIYGSEPGLPGACRVSPEAAARLFEDFIIPRTIEVEVDYLLGRLG